MNLEKPITLQSSKYTDQATGKIETPPPIVLTKLDIIYTDSPSEQTYHIVIKEIPFPILLFSGESYSEAGEISITKANERFLELADNDLESFLQKQFPKSLEDDPYGPGSILHGMFAALGIKSTPTCSCRRHAMEMNEKGIEWCEENLPTILSWLKDETQKRKLPWSETVASLVVKKAINRSKKYREANERARRV